MCPVVLHKISWTQITRWGVQRRLVEDVPGDWWEAQGWWSRCYFLPDCLDQNEASTEKLKHRYDLTTTVELLQYLGFEITSLYELQFLAFLFKYALVQMCKDVYMKLRFHSEEMTESVGREFHPKVVIELVGYVSCQGFLHPLCSKWKNSTSWFG